MVEQMGKRSGHWRLVVLQYEWLSIEDGRWTEMESGRAWSELMIRRASEAGDDGRQATGSWPGLLLLRPEPHDMHAICASSPHAIHHHEGLARFSLVVLRIRRLVTCDWPRARLSALRTRVATARSIK